MSLTDDIYFRRDYWSLWIQKASRAYRFRIWGFNPSRFLEWTALHSYGSLIEWWCLDSPPPSPYCHQNLWWAWGVIGFQDIWMLSGVLLVSMVENQCIAKVSGDTVYYDLTSDVSALWDLDSIFSIHNVIAGIQMLFNKYLLHEECLDNDCDTGQIGRLGL